MKNNDVLIITINDDISTDRVIEWLNRFSIKWHRINAEDYFETSFSLNLINNKSERLGRGVIWFRKWRKTYFFKNEDFSRDLIKEFTSYSNYLFNKYFGYNKTGTFRLNKPGDLRIDKLTQLNTAFEMGLIIPFTLFTTQKKDVIKFLEINLKLITKTLSATLFVQTENAYLMSYTRDVEADEIYNLPVEFFPTLFQQKIIKRYDIRTFYLDGEFSSMAIFSQSDDQTKTDFRRYNYENPNRTVPYKLPQEIEKKLTSLMIELGVNSGSIDLVLDENGNYVFLEVNPIGQFGMVSAPCNYHLEKKIAILFKQKLNNIAKSN